MPTLADLLSWMDNKRRVVGRNMSDLATDPSGYLSMTAANIPQTIAEQGAGMAPMGLSVKSVGFGGGGKSQIIDALERFAARQKKPSEYVEPPYVPPVYSAEDLALDAKLWEEVNAKLVRQGMRPDGQRVFPEYRMQRPISDLIDPRAD